MLPSRGSTDHINAFWKNREDASIPPGSTKLPGHVSPLHTCLYEWKNTHGHTKQTRGSISGEGGGVGGGRAFRTGGPRRVCGESKQGFPKATALNSFTNTWHSARVEDKPQPLEISRSWEIMLLLPIELQEPFTKVPQIPRAFN